MNLTSAIPGMDCSAGRRKGRVGRLIAAGILAAALLGLLVLTLADLRRAASPIVFPVEDGVYNLTAEALVTTPEEAGGYVLYTNSTKIGVTIVSDAEQSGTVTLVDAATGDAVVTISDARTISFWHGLRAVLGELLSLLAGS